MNDQKIDVIDNIPEPPPNRTKSSLDKINDDCMLEPLKYLSLMELSKSALQVPRIPTIAMEYLFPQKAKKLKIYLLSEGDMVPDGITEFPEGATDLEAYFLKGFGEFVKGLSLAGLHTGRTEKFKRNGFGTCEKLLSSCLNIDSLCLNSVDFGANSSLLNNVSPSLKKLKLFRCSGITTDCSKAFKRLPQIENITITENQGEITGDFFKHFSNLTNLTIDNKSLPKTEDLQLIFEQYGQNIRKLKLLHYTKSPDYRTIGTLIAERLPELEKLFIEDIFSDNLTIWLPRLPHLKSLKLNFCGKSVNSVLRMLSGQNIEALHFFCYVFNNEEDAPQLVFNQLQSVEMEYALTQHSVALFNALTMSQMPALTTLNVQFNVKAMNNLLKLIESKLNLELMTSCCSYWNEEQKNKFVCDIINILKKNEKRPIFNLNIPDIKIGTDLVSKTIRRISWLNFYNFLLYIFTDERAQR